METNTDKIRTCYFDANAGGFLYQLWKTLPICETCGRRGPVCPACVGGLDRWDLSKYEDELDFKENDRVDVFIKDAHGWVSGVVISTRLSEFCYIISLETGEDARVSFWPSMEDDYGIAPGGMYCLQDWRENIKFYSDIECRINDFLDDWISCKNVFHCEKTDRILVVVDAGDTTESYWFHRNSPNIRHVWDWK